MVLALLAHQKGYEGGAGLRMTALDSVNGLGQQGSEATLIKGMVLVCLSSWCSGLGLGGGAQASSEAWKCEAGDLCTVRW